MDGKLNMASGQQGEKVRVVSEFAGGVTIRIPGTFETMVLYSGSFE